MEKIYEGITIESAFSLCQNQFPDNKFRFGCIIYRDNAIKEV